VLMDAPYTLTAIYGRTITPIVYLPFNENTGTSTTNRGTVGGTLAFANINNGFPAWVSSAPASIGGGTSVAFGPRSGMMAVDSASPINQLGGLSEFTVCGWLNLRSVVQSGVGNVIVSWLDPSTTNGVELLYKSDGSLAIAVNQGYDGSQPRSNPAKI